MKIYELRVWQLQALFKVVPAWVAFNNPSWTASHNPEWMVEHQPAWMCEHQHAYMGQHHPEIMSHFNPEWMCIHHPVWMLKNRPDGLEELRPEWILLYRPMQMAKAGRLAYNRIVADVIRRIKNEVQTREAISVDLVEEVPAEIKLRLENVEGPKVRNRSRRLEAQAVVH